MSNAHHSVEWDSNLACQKDGHWSDNAITNTNQEQDSFLFQEHAELLTGRVLEADTPITIDILDS